MVVDETKLRREKDDRSDISIGGKSPTRIRPRSIDLQRAICWCYFRCSGTNLVMMSRSQQFRIPISQVGLAEMKYEESGHTHLTMSVLALPRASSTTTTRGSLVSNSMVTVHSCRSRWSSSSSAIINLVTAIVIFWQHSIRVGRNLNCKPNNLSYVPLRYSATRDLMRQIGLTTLLLPNAVFACFVFCSFLHSTVLLNTLSHSSNSFILCRTMSPRAIIELDIAAHPLRLNQQISARSTFEGKHQLHFIVYLIEDVQQRHPHQ